MYVPQHARFVQLYTPDQLRSDLHRNPRRIERVLQHEAGHLPGVLRLCIVGDLCGQAQQVAGEVLLLELLELLLGLVASVAIWTLRVGQDICDIGGSRHQAALSLLAT